MSSPSLAPPPFDRESADLIFRTCDDVDFRVHKCILAIASPLHNDASEAESLGPTTDSKDGADGAESRTVILVTEDSDVLDKLLRFVYPVASPSLETLDELKPVLEAALKYQMDETTDVLRTMLVSKKFLESEALRVFAIACFHGFEKETRIAAMYACYKGLPGPNIRELSSITASATRALWELKDKAAGPACLVVSNLAWLAESDEVNRDWVFFVCTECEEADTQVQLRHARVSPRSWWHDYLRTAEEQLKNCSCGATVTSDWLIQSTVGKFSNRCNTCSIDGKGLADLKAFSRLLAARVDDVVMEVACTLKFQ
ncbi:hypothetical protein NEOLEDRAFT_1139239 [Neolentinus lepideus HHB14362 ss-1]|uniref:BTB domain-containing protein n=1 Tax=Neolentinus lepideus HHB14362 ss-1 TaxID=1314782 RepID=A0A165PXA2_9AGAM|nr:hypothetical protein NEOLEDRAFT_1139239 [Neolentinus lepideus HHB14362 ss-1]